MGSNKQYTLKKGTVLDGRYEIEEVIGEGGFGITYKGVHKSIGMTVAIKEYFSKDIMDRDTSESDKIKLTWEENKKTFEKDKKRFLKEARIVSDFSKEDGVVHIMDYFEANNTVYIVMEYVEGVSLRDYIKENGTMSVDDVLRKMLPVIHTLDKIHECGVIHRDIGPNNIMVEKDGNFRLIDFGSAREYEDLDEKSYSIVLTGGYAPPEQYDKEGKLGPWTDVYAVCAVIYYAITGYSPQEALSRMLYDELEKPSDRGVSIKSDVEKIILKGLSVNPKDRYQSMNELEDAIKPYIEEKEKKGPKNKLLIAGLAVAIAAIAVVGGIFGWNKYYETHKEQIIFGDEPVQHILIGGDDEVSVKDFNDSKAVIEKRLDVLTNGKYMMEEKNGQLRIAIPNSIVGKEKKYHSDKTYQDMDDFIESYISKPNYPYVYDVDEKERYIDPNAKSVMITDKDVESFSIKNGKSKAIDLGANIQTERQKIMNDVNTYYEIKLTDKCINEFKNNKIDKYIRIIYDDRNIKDQDNEKTEEAYYDPNKGTICIQCDVQSPNIRKLCKYNWTHEKTKDALSVMGYDTAIEWEKPSKSTVRGNNQVAEDKINNPSIIYLYKYDDSFDDLSEGQESSVMIDFKKRMDSLSVDYAMGKDKNCEDKNFAVKIAQNDVNTYLMSSVINEGYNTVTLSSQMRDSEFEYYYGSLKVQSNNGKKEIVLNYDEYNKDELKKFTENVLKDGEKEVFLGIGKCKVAKANINKVIKNGKIVFSDYLVNTQKEKKPYNYYTVMKVLNNETRMDKSFDYYGCIWLDKDGKLEDPTSRVINDLPNNKTKYDQVKKLLQEAAIDDITLEPYEENAYKSNIVVNFPKTEYGNKDIKGLVSIINTLVTKCDLLNGDFEEITFYFPDERGNKEGLEFEKDSTKGKYEKKLSIGLGRFNKKKMKKEINKYFGKYKWSEYSD